MLGLSSSRYETSREVIKWYRGLIKFSLDQEIASEGDGIVANDPTESGADLHEFASARRFVDCSDDCHVSTSHFARYGSFTAADHTICKVIHLGSLLINPFVGQRSTTRLSNRAVVIESTTREFVPTFFTFGTEHVSIAIETGSCLAGSTVGEVHCPDQG